MFPPGETGRLVDKRRKRLREFRLIATYLRPMLPSTDNGRRARILELGCGAAEGATQLAKLGQLVVTDIYRHERLSLPPNVRFELCDIQRAPFGPGQFDVVVANHVIEHIQDLSSAFAEMKRIARDSAVFALAVPTSTWLLLSVPGKLWKKAENLFRRKRRERRNADRAIRRPTEPSRPASRGSRLRDRIGLGGHGCYPGFTECFRTFRVSRWRTLLGENGFEVLREEPLLCYGSSHWPVVPTNRILAKAGLASSHLFILRRCRDRSESPGEPRDG